MQRKVREAGKVGKYTLTSSAQKQHQPWVDNIRPKANYRERVKSRLYPELVTVEYEYIFHHCFPPIVEDKVRGFIKFEKGLLGGKDQDVAIMFSLCDLRPRVEKSVFL